MFCTNCYAHFVPNFCCAHTKKHPLLTMVPPTKCTQLLCAHIAELVLNMCAYKSAAQCARILICFPSNSGSKTGCAHTQKCCMSEWFHRKLEYAHMFVSVRALSSNVHVQFVAVRLSVSTGTNICSVQCAAQCRTVLHTGGIPPLHQL